MGCDIHIVLEKYDDEFGWVGVDTFIGHESSYTKGYSSPIACERNYARFAALAGVRGDGPAPRGIPNDASSTTKLLIKEWGADAHSHSWLPLVAAAREWNIEHYAGVKPNEFREKYPAAYWFGVGDEVNKMDKYRVIFWFDN